VVIALVVVGSLQLLQSSQQRAAACPPARVRLFFFVAPDVGSIDSIDTGH
jgi:hypothetical protein